jgi:hypothetical protein
LDVKNGRHAGIAMAVVIALTASLCTVAPAAGNATVPKTSTSVFKLKPGKDRVDVTVKVTVTNRIPNKVTVAPCPGDPGRTCRNTTRFYVDSFGYFSIQRGGRGVRFTGPGVKARIDHKNDYYTNYVVSFAPIYAGQSRTFKATYYLPASWPRSPNRTRVTEAYAHFCWHGQPTDRGSATAILPRSYVPSTQGGLVTTKRTRNGVVLRAKRSAQLGRFYACTDSFQPGKLMRTETVSPGGQTVTVEGWPGDPEWSAAITTGVEKTLPRLEKIVGTPIPADDVVVRQVASQALGGYAGDFDDRSDAIRVGEKYDDPFLVAHELSHAWFNRSTVKDTWIMEGHAEWMSYQANLRACSRPGTYPGKGKPNLGKWRYLGVNPTKREQDVVDFQYQAACSIVQRIEWLAGLDGMAEISQALLERTPKYGGSVRKNAPKPDWREWLDAVDELGPVPAWRVHGMDGAEKLLLEYGIARPRDLEGRVEARTAYHEALDGPWGVYMPTVVRDLMDDWKFDKATKALDLSDRIISTATAAEIDGADDMVARVGTVMREARTIDRLRAIRRRLDADPASFEPVPTQEPAQQAPRRTGTRPV